MIAVAAYAVVCVEIARLRVPSAVVFVVVVPFVLLVPGMTLVIAARIPRLREAPGRRILFSVVLSLGNLVLGGLVLNALGRLTSGAWTLWILGVTAVGLGWWGFRARRDARHGSLEPRWMVDRLGRPSGLALGQFAFAAGVVALAVALTEASAHRSYDRPITRITVLPAGAGGRRVRLTIANLGASEERLVLQVTGGTSSSRPISLSVPAGATWSRRETMGSRRLVATLRRPDTARTLAMVQWALSPSTAIRVPTVSRRHPHHVRRRH